MLPASLVTAKDQGPVPLWWGAVQDGGDMEEAGLGQCYRELGALELPLQVTLSMPGWEPCLLSS